jgi:hypothetical protein
VRAACLLVFLAWSLLGCPRREETAAPTLTPMGLQGARAAPHRCTLDERRFASTSEALDAPWLLRGPDGPRVLGRTSSSGLLFWRDARAEASIPSSLSLAPHAVAWTGRGFFGVLDGRATFTDARFDAPHPVRRLAFDRAISISTAAREGAVLVAWLKEGREGDAEGSPWAAMVGPGGELLMDAQPLTGAPAALRSLHARWDFGRFVVEGETVGGPFESWSWVLEPDGRSAWSGQGPLVCPLSGCMRVDFHAGPGGRSQALRFVALNDPSISIDTNIFTNDVLAAAVSGDRVLVLHSPLQGELGCAVHVYDVGHRQVAHESSSELLGCAPGSALATPEGFVILEVDPSRGLTQRSLTCGDDA